MSATSPNVVRLYIAGPMLRLFAFLLDVIVLLAADWCLGLVLPQVPEVVSLLMAFCYFWLLHAWRGQSVGKWVAGIRVVSPQTGHPPTLGAAAVRAALSEGLPFVPVIGWLLFLFDVAPLTGTRDRQCAHDMIARTVVVTVPAEDSRMTRFLPRKVS
ncbi:RDD family protein [Nonomuraea sp. NPDC050556]|uniref:RDD family protein n=1 Tax=Nonomuraea sp. NPDC050556 TaxID=3364369 RepID=UPI00379303C5